MTQNTSHAVMAQRKEARDSLDHFPTPPWGTRALCDWLEANVGCLDGLTCWEPACGEGHMAKPLEEYFEDVLASDVHNYSFGVIADFLWHDTHTDAYDWIITNPPFRLGEQFITTALTRAQRGVAMLVRTAFLESADRHAKLFSVTPPTDILQFVERVPMFKGRLDRTGSTATAYCWLVWRKNMHGAPYRRETMFHWIAPCRKRLERDSDYPIEVSA